MSRSASELLGRQGRGRNRSVRARPLLPEARPSAGRASAREPRGRSPRKEKAAIVARLRDLPGVQTIYFQDPGHALKLAKLSDPDSKPDGPSAGSFYVKFSDPALARAIAPAITADARRPERCGRFCRRNDGQGPSA